MRTSFRQTVLATSAILGLSGFAAAAPPAAGDPTAIHASATTPDQSSTQAQRDARHTVQGNIEQRIGDLHARLQISPSQQPQWEQFAGVMRDNARDMDQTFRQRVHTLAAMTAAENMQSYAQLATEHAQEMQKLVPAFQELYGSMSDNQKRTADKVFRDDAHQPRHG